MTPDGDWRALPPGAVIDGVIDCGLFLLGPGVPAARRPERVRCAAAILPGADSAAMGGRLDTPCAVTYGLSSRDTLTLSSLSGREAVLALQREVVDLAGRCHERQEWSVIMPPGVGRMQLLAIEAARIVAGTAAC
jgi:hypothetical protein